MSYNKQRQIIILKINKVKILSVQFKLKDQ